MKNLIDEMNENNSFDMTQPAMGISHPLMARAGRPIEFGNGLSQQTINESIKALALKITPNLAISLSSEQDSCMEIQCRWFFGRCRWSTLLTEEFLKELLKNPNSSTKQPVLNAVRTAKAGIMKALEEQLQRVQSQPWIEKLYLMAIRADVFSQASIVKDDTARLVTEGFALVAPVRVEVNPAYRWREVRGLDAMEIASGPGSQVLLQEPGNTSQFTRVWLCEPSAVDTIMSYLRTSSKYDEVMEEFFSLLQVDDADHGAIGKIAEYIFASVSI